MDRLYGGSPNDAEVDALLSQFNDENILKLKLNTHQTATQGFDYPTSTGGGGLEGDDEDLDNQLASRFSSLKQPISSAKKKRKDSSKRGSNSDPAGAKKGNDAAVIGGKSGGRRGRNSEADGDDDEKEENENEAERRAAENSVKPSNRVENGSKSGHRQQRKQATDLQYFKSLDSRAEGTIGGGEKDDFDDIDAQLRERFRALKAPFSPPPTGSIGSDDGSAAAASPRQGREAGKEDYKSKGGSRILKANGKDSEKAKKEKKGKKGHNSNTEDSNPAATVKDMKKLLSSVADRVGLEKNRMSSADEDEFLGEDQYWSALDGEDELAGVSTEEDDLNREAEKVIKWAKDAARLDVGNSDEESEADEFKLDAHKDDDSEDGDSKGAPDVSDGSIPGKVKNQKKKGIKAAPRKKRWGLF